MTTMEPASTAPASRIAAPTAGSPLSPLFRSVLHWAFSGHITWQLYAVLLGIAGYIIFRSAVVVLPNIPTLFPAEHMRVGDVTFSPATAFIRMEQAAPPVTALTIDTQDIVAALPETLGHVSSLRSLTIINQPLDTLPESLGRLTNLETLAIYNSPIRALPQSIGNLTHLKELTLVGGNVSSLPASMANLTSLQTLNLAYNHIHALPTAIAALPNLTMVDLTGNTLQSLPAAFGPNVTAVFMGGTGVSHASIMNLETPTLYIYY